MSDDLDCGDNSCEFSKREGGWGTNGGCMCLDGLPSGKKLTLRKFIHNLKSALAEKDAEIAKLRKEIQPVEISVDPTKLGSYEDLKAQLQASQERERIAVEALENIRKHGYDKCRGDHTGFPLYTDCRDVMIGSVDKALEALKEKE